MYDIKTTYNARSVDEALELLSMHKGAVLVCGGTDVMIRMKERRLREAVLISILDIDELKGVQLLENGDIRIGPGTCFAELYNSPILRQHVPFLAEACNQVGSPQIRHVASIGGNLCNGAVSADSVPALMTLSAELELTGKSGTRKVNICDFHTGPGKTVLRPESEILTAIYIPRKNYQNHGGSYIKFGQRRAMEIATISCAVNAALESSEHIGDFAIAFGVAAPTPIRCPKAEAWAVGKTPDEIINGIGAMALGETKPRESWRGSLELREQLIRELSKRAARQAIERAGGTTE